LPRPSAGLGSVAGRSQRLLSHPAIELRALSRRREDDQKNAEDACVLRTSQGGRGGRAKRKNLRNLNTRKVTSTAGGESHIALG
jgi:hypothetical protein